MQKLEENRELKKQTALRCSVTWNNERHGLKTGDHADVVRLCGHVCLRRCVQIFGMPWTAYAR